MAVKKARPRTPALDDLEATYRRTVAAALVAWRAARNAEHIEAAWDDLAISMRGLEMVHRLYVGEIRRLGGR